MKVSDFGLSAHQRTDHWEADLSKPLQITYQEINKNLNKLVSTFPLDSIPHQTSDEKVILHIKKEIKQLKINLYHA